MDRLFSRSALIVVATALVTLAACTGDDPELPGVTWPARRILGPEDGLARPDGLWTLADGRVLIANEGKGEILVADVDRLEVEVRVPQGGGLRTPEEVTVGPGGAIYITDDLAVKVFKVTGDDAPVALLGADDGLQSPEGIAVAEDGTLYIADEATREVVSWSPGGAMRVLADSNDGLRAPEALALGPDGTLYITDDRRGGVFAISPGGRVRILITAEVLKKPEGVAVDRAGDLWVTDNYRAATVRRFSPGGDLREVIRVPVSAGALAGIALLGDGRLVVSVSRKGELSELWLLEEG